MRTPALATLVGLTLFPAALFSLAAVVALAAMLGGCGVSFGPFPTAPPTPPPTPAPPVVVAQGGGSLEADFIGQVPPFTTTSTGTLDATVDWTFAANDVDVFLARGNCTPRQFLDGQCNIGAMSVSTTAKPERVRLTGAAPGVYTLLLRNAGPGDESLSWQVVLTPTAASASVVPVRSLDLPDKARSYRGTVSW